MLVKNIFAVWISLLAVACVSKHVQAPPPIPPEPPPLAQNPPKCLNAEEKSRILKAYQMARYYKYYDTLVQGKDTIEVIKAEKLEDVVIADDEYRAIFKVVLRIRIDDATFDRTFTLPIFYSRKNDPEDPSGIWANVKKDFWKFGTGFAIGTLTGIGICAAK